MRDSYVIVYNEGNDRTSYIEETRDSEVGMIAQTVPTVVYATLYDTWDEAMEVIQRLRDAPTNNGMKSGMFFPLSVNKKDIFLARLKGR